MITTDFKISEYYSLQPNPCRTALWTRNAGTVTHDRTGLGVLQYLLIVLWADINQWHGPYPKILAGLPSYVSNGPKCKFQSHVHSTVLLLETPLIH